MKKLSRNVYEEITNHKDFNLAVRTFEQIIYKATIKFEDQLAEDPDTSEFELFSICQAMMMKAQPKLEKGMLVWICNNFIPQHYTYETRH